MDGRPDARATRIDEGLNGASFCEWRRLTLRKNQCSVVAVKSLTQPTEIGQPISRMAYTTTETAKALGIDEVTIWRLTKRGLLKPNRATRRPLYAVTEIERFLKEGRI